MRQGEPRASLDTAARRSRRQAVVRARRGRVQARFYGRKEGNCECTPAPAPLIAPAAHHPHVHTPQALRPDLQERAARPLAAARHPTPRPGDARLPATKNMAATKKALIVHPAFPLAPAPAPAPEPAFIERLPLAVLHAIAEHLDAAQDLIRFERVCRSCRWGGVRGGRRAAHAAMPSAPPLPCPRPHKALPASRPPCAPLPDRRRDIAQDQSLWRRLTLSKFMMPSCTDVDDWRQLYRCGGSLPIAVQPLAQQPGARARARSHPRPCCSHPPRSPPLPKPPTPAAGSTTTSCTTSCCPRRPRTWAGCRWGSPSGSPCGPRPPSSRRRPALEHAPAGWRAAAMQRCR